MDKKYSSLPLRSGVGIVVLNEENKVFVAKRIDNQKDFTALINQIDKLKRKVFQMSKEIIDN